MTTERQTADRPTTLPLAGVRIIDISNVFSLPYAGGLLTDLGAEVIKIEGPGRLDVSRGGQFSGVYPDNEPGDDPWNRTSTFNLLNRGKKSLAIDLRRPEGREVLKDLIRVSDVLMENFTPRVMRGWELDYPNARKLNPNVIMVSCSGYGPQGPYARTPPRQRRRKRRTGLRMSPAIAGVCRPRRASHSWIFLLPGRWSWGPRWRCATGTDSARVFGSMWQCTNLAATWWQTAFWIGRPTGG